MYNITHLFKTYFPDSQGGLEEAIRQIAKYSNKKGFNSKVLTVSENPQESIQDSIFVKSYKKSFEFLSNPYSFKLSKNFKHEISKTDILHLQFPWPTGEIFTLINQIKKPIVLTFHCDVFNKGIGKYFYQPIINKILDRADVIVPTSENLLNNTKILQKYRSKTEVINLWLDEDRFILEEKPDDSIINFVENLKNGFALFIGVLRWYKGLEILINAAKKTKNDIIIVGKGPQYNYLKKKVLKEKINNVHLVGYQKDSNVKYFLQKCIFTILPSISSAEAFGQVLLESSYYSKPMISTELGTGTSYVNKHNVTGFVAEPNNINQLAEYMNLLFKKNDLVKQFGNNAKNRYEMNFTETKQGEKYIDIYNKLL